MKIIFAGTPEFAATALKALLDAGPDTGFRVIAAYTQPDRPAGRGMKLTASAVKTLALARGIPVFQPPTLKTFDAQAEMAALDADMMVVAAYGLILPQAVLDIPHTVGGFGCLNLHASLLPRWRGAAPIHRAILAGDKQSGVTIMQMEAGLDTGPVLLETFTAIGARETTGQLNDRLATLGAEAIVQLARGFPCPNRSKRFQQYRPGVEARLHLHDGHTGLLVARQNGAVNRRGTPPARQQRRMKVEATKAPHGVRNVEHCLRQDEAISRHYHHIGVQRGHFGLRVERL